MSRWKKIAKFCKKYKKENYGISDKKSRKKEKAFKKKWGFSYIDSWNLDVEMVLYILPRLAYLREHHIGLCNELCEFDENMNIVNEEKAIKAWNDVLDTMIDGFMLYLEKDTFNWTEKDKKLWETTMKYFTKYYMALWD